MSKTQNFPDKIRIVLKKKYNSDDEQGFIALDDKSLETGLSWAGISFNRDKNLDRIVEYENGNFILRVSKAAESSYQQGKLSFWTLVATAPDGRVFEVGINSESLLATIFESVMTNGELDGMFYLGRTQGQQSISKKEGLYYREYLEQLEIKKSPLTKKYGAGSIIINNLERLTYIGEFKNYFEIDTIYPRGSSDYRKVSIRKISEPRTMHLYEHSYNRNGNTFRYYYFEKEKMSGRIVESISKDQVDAHINEFNTSILESINKAIQEQSNGERHWDWSIEKNIRDYFCLNSVIEYEKVIEDLGLKNNVV